MFKNKLKKLRKDNGHTQEYMALQLNISRPTYTRYETGEREPDYLMLKQIAIFFNVSLDYLLDVTDTPTPLTAEIESNPESIREKTLKETIQSTDELSEESKADMLRQLSLVKLRDKSGLVETAAEFHVNPVET
ncbi:MAG: helix-turn-helix transcriptional regulator [Oscillospiraceae bacterium]|nr:helix-turn-helix transcriptional regulator [Oscillospiraceae bacterium]